MIQRLTALHNAAKAERASKKTLHTQWVENLWKWLRWGSIGIVLWFILLMFFGNLPKCDQLENPNINDASQIITTDGRVLGRYYVENRVRVRYENLSPYLVKALVATEDERFYKHAGIDGVALSRVLLKTLVLGKSSAGGGSTITQQLAKLLFKRRDLRGKILPVKVWILVNTKFKEWITAARLERRYTKEEIITMYLNQFDFIYGAYGIKSAAETYFGTTPDSLKIEEAAMLIGMLKNPTLYNPKRFPENAKKRREVVLDQMRKNGHLSQAEYDSLRRLPIILRFNRTDHNKGPAPFFREILRKEVETILADKKKADGSYWNVYTDGLKIYTTIDSRMQEHGEAAARKHLSELQKTFFKHWEKRDPWTDQLKEQDPRRIAREKSFDRLVRETERYATLRDQYLTTSASLDLRDVDIIRMLEIEKQGWTLRDQWLEQGIINRDLSRAYLTVMGKDFDNEEWRTIKQEWNSLQRAVDKMFNKPVQMKVFAYNPEGEIDTIMSPFDSLRYHRMILQVGLMSMDPKTGEVKAWVGGVDHKYFKFDHVNPTVQRQVGSTFKPFLYSAFVSNGYSPCYEVFDGPVTIEAGEGRFGLIRNWTPKNAGGFSYQYVTLIEGLRKSLNSVSATLMKELKTTQPLRLLVHKMGIDTSRVPASPSIALGAADLSVYEMTGAYSSFANNGIYTKPYFISRIEDARGNIIYEAEIEQRKVLEEQPNYAMVQLLKGVVAGKPGAWGVKSEVGGKTGTTNEHADGWFMGITPNLVTGTWVGGDDRWIRFRAIYFGQGARMAMPIFAEYQKRVDNDPRIKFDVAARFHVPDIISIEMDCAKYAAQMPDGVDFEEYTPTPEGTEEPDVNFEW